ncbi:hypothetical protein [Pleurocapsa sp. PCC 7319]|uniref:hypothetical protein n=1 Tax=Pleurocapsa sp. PCC 7319 TaxID=118161 RepID=UPI0003643386|nr:hypothetical protein [Pleurocapsa sp. PCC 7319]
MLTDDQRVLNQLAFARRKLFAPDIPLCLKAISYVRICCSAMKKLDYFPSNDRGSNDHKTPYLSLLKSLSQRDSQWWNKCQVTNEGRLRSDDPIIDQLLQPLNHFIDCQMFNTLSENRPVDEQFKELSNLP